MATEKKSNGSVSIEKLVELRNLAERDNDTELIDKINKKLSGKDANIAKLIELRDLAERDNDTELFQKVNIEIDKLTGPSMLPGGQGIPFSEQHRSGRSTLTVPTEQPPVGLMRGEERNPNLLERLVTPGLEKPFDIKDLAVYGGATMGAALAPELALPGILSRLGPVTPFLRQAPQIAGAGAGGGAGRMVESAAEGGDLTDILAAGGRGFQEFAGAEAAGVGLGSALSTGARAITGKSMTQGEKELVKFARKNKLYLPISGLREGTGLASKLEKASDLTAFGNYLRQRAANKIDKAIEQQVTALTPYAKPPEVIAPQAQTLLKEILEGTTESKNIAYDRFANAIGKETTVDTQLIKQGVEHAIDQAKSQGKSRLSNVKALKEFLEFEGENTFGSLERLRKDTVNALNKSAKTKEIAKPVLDAFDQTYQQLGRTRGFDLNDAITQADIEMNKLLSLKRVPGLERFSKEVQKPKGWIFGFVNENNKQALKILKDKSPETYQALIEQRLSLAFERNGEFNPNNFVKFVNDNPTFIKETYGDETAKVLENFSNYIKTSSELRKAKSKQFSELAGAIRGAGLSGLTGTLFRSPALTAGTELSGVVLSSMLTRPNSWLYRLFSASDPVAISKALKTVTPFLTRTQAEQFGSENLQQNIEQGQTAVESIFKRPQ